MIRASITGEEEVVQSLINLQLGLGDLSPLMDWAGRYLSNSTAERFHTKTNPEGVQWEQLKAPTIKRKGHDNILVDSSDLMDSITYSADATHAHIFSDDSNQDKVYTHQFGYAAKKVPKRAIFGLSDSDSEALKNQTLIWIEGLL